MRPAQEPVVLELEIALKVEQQGIAGHDAAGEEVFGEPVARVTHLKGVGENAVGKNVHE